MVHILYTYVSEKNHQYLLKNELKDFSLDFQKRVYKYQNWKDAQLSLLGRMLLRRGLKTLNKANLHKNLKYTTYNKPYLEDETIHFNISHSGNITICAISENQEIGIDIEIIKSVELDDFKDYMTGLEWQKITSSNNIEHAFFKYWTQKEAVMKANGTGFSTPLNAFEVLNHKTSIKDKCFFFRRN